MEELARMLSCTVGGNFALVMRRSACLQQQQGARVLVRGCRESPPGQRRRYTANWVRMRTTRQNARRVQRARLRRKSAASHSGQVITRGSRPGVPARCECAGDCAPPVRAISFVARTTDTKAGYLPPRRRARRQPLSRGHRWGHEGGRGGGDNGSPHIAARGRLPSPGYK